MIDQVIKSLTVISLVIGIVLGLLRIKQALTERRAREMAPGSERPDLIAVSPDLLRDSISNTGVT